MEKDKINNMSIFQKIAISFRKFQLVIAIALVVFVTASIFLSTRKKEAKYLVQEGKLENSAIVTAYVVKQEHIINVENIPKITVIADGEKVAKGGIIATYKSQEYEKYLQDLEQIDTQIHTLMKSMPPVYSSEMESIENEIRETVKTANNVSSRVAMQACINQTNDLINKRANVVALMSSKNSELNKAIEKRDEYVESAKNSSEHVIATQTGIVTYTLDGLENELNAKDIKEITYDEISELTKKTTTQSGVKIVNNYLAYIMVRLTEEQMTYIKKDNTYTIRLIENDKVEVKGSVVKISDYDNASKIVLFEITNNIENLINTRMTEIELVLWTSSGMYVPLDAIETKQINGQEISFIKIIKYGEYVSMPINILKKTDKYCIVANYTQEQLEIMGYNANATLRIYDRIVMED